jgi:hypothetical protein
MHRYGPMYGPDVPPGPETIGWMARQRMRSFETTEIGARGLTACLVDGTPRG